MKSAPYYPNEKPYSAGLLGEPSYIFVSVLLLAADVNCFSDAPFNVERSALRLASAV